LSILAKSATSSFSWNVAGSIVRYGAAFIINIVLARILGPEPFGLVALALIFISIGNLLIESGLASGVIQKTEINKQDIQYVFTIQFILALVISGLIFAFAPLIARIYNQPKVIPVLQVFTIILFLQSASQTSTALLQRKLAFKRIQQSQIVSYLVGYLAIGLPLAYKGYGVWSLVLAQLLQTFLYLVFVYSFARHTIGFNFRDPGGISRFGINILGANIANWILNNYDNTSIGWAYGTTNLGLYNRAWSLAMTPVGMVVSSAQSVLFSASSKLQESTERVRDAFLGIFTLFGITFFPFSICESIVAVDLVQFVYGDKWHASAPILAVLALAMPFFVLMAIEGPVLAGLGKPQLEFKIQWIAVGFAIIIFIFAIRSSMMMIVWSVCVIYIFRFLILSIVSFKILKISKSSIQKILFSIIIFSIIATAGVFIISYLTAGLSVYIRLPLQGVVAILTWIITFFIGWNYFLPGQVQKLINPIIPKKFLPMFAKINRQIRKNPDAIA
jgi:O-antigen/teichoic acid export membrane protein